MMKICTISVILSLSILISIISATSSGIGVYDCDVYSEAWGCNPSDWTGGNRKMCEPDSGPTRIMSWVASPQRTNAFRLFVGEHESESQSNLQYTPDQFFRVGIVQTDYDMRWRGLMLYAVDSSGAKVGEWMVPSENPIKYHTPIASCGENVVLHAGALVKQGRQFFFFRAPAGTGKITFHALVKEGDANVGSFYWPNLQGDISVDEGSVSGATSWEKTGLGQSCSEYCQSKSQYCDSASFGEITSAQDLEPISSKYGCKLPYLNSCEGFGAFTDDSNFCYYPQSQSQCDLQKRPYYTTRCDAKASDVYRFCRCSTDSGANKDATDYTRSSGNPYDTNPVTTTAVETTEDEFLNSTSSQSSILSVNLSILLAACFSMFTKNSKVFVVALLGLYLIGSADAHNWLNSPSRSLIASTTKPCPVRPAGAKPHAQVGPGQFWQVEWMQGHPDQPPSYFVLVKAEDQDKLTKHTTALLEKYISDALAAGVSNTASQDIYQRLHWTRDTYDNAANGNRYANVISSGSMMLEKPAAFTERVNQRETLWQYKSSDISEDIRIEYNHPEYDWIISVHRFPHNYDEPGRFDTARFSIPGNDYGEYILHWLWAGYYDCVDVSYIDQQVENIYGLDDPNEPTTFSRIDHCYFPGIVSDGIYNPSGPWGYKRVLQNDPVQCLEGCRINGDECQHVQVIPRHLPDLVKPQWAQKHGIFQTMYNERYNMTRTSWEGDGSFVPTLEILDELYPGEDELICYDLSPRSRTQTEDVYILSDDPEDPVFYSTCYVMNNKKVFVGYETVESAPQSVEWRYGEYCISCEDHTKISSSDYLAPFWKIADTCVNCDREPAVTSVPRRIQYNMVRNASICSSGISWENTTDDSNFRHGTCDPEAGIRCSIRVGQTGNGFAYFTAEQCAAIVYDADYCSNTFIRRNDETSPCWCQSSEPCCQECSSMSYEWTEDYIIYEVTDEEIIPDPTCEHGTLSLDGTACCSETCGERLCNDNRGRREVYGHCSAPDVIRSCNEYPAPCYIE
eukprot:TRINITY_DN6131_c0_g1_i1.p1 TRINITY_DN6131_c0_g1~~TRINITY_DN6131_c0_g1_i1.p1  ORF type:complete len:1020 (+),score=191.04 TRINITY_DN6131_c0_g1_i1:8-3067(+)